MQMYRVDRTGISFLGECQIPDKRKMNRINSVAVWGQVNPPSPEQVGALPGNSPRLTHISPTGIYTGTLSADQII